MITLPERPQVALDDITVARRANSAECCLDQQASSDLKSSSLQYKRPEAFETRKKQNERLPESFDELAPHLDQEFGRLAAEAEQMANELREAETQAEQLRHRLLDGRSF